MSSKTENNYPVQHLEGNLIVELSKVNSLESALDCILKTTTTINDLHCGGIYLFDTKTDNLNLIVHKGLSKDLVDEVSSYNSGSERYKIVKKGVPIYILLEEFMNSINDHSKILLNEGLKAIATLPIIYNNEVIGGLNLGSHTALEISERNKISLELIAAYISSTIVRITSQERINEDDSNIKTLFESLDDLIMIINKNNQLIHYSTSVKKLLEYSDEELLDIEINKLFPQDLKEKIISYFNFEIYNQIDDFPLISKYGQLFNLETKLSKGYWHKEEVIFAISRDISERTKTEEQIRKSQILYSTTVNAIKEWIYVIDNKLNIVLVNDTLINIHKLLNLPLDIIGKNICEIYSFLPQHILTDHEIIFKTGKEITREHSQILDGKVFHLEAKVTPIFSGSEVILALITLKDITKQKIAEIEIRKEEERFRDITLSMGDFVWEMDENGMITYLSGKFEEISGYHPEDVIGKSLVNFLDPDNVQSGENLNIILTRQEKITDYEFIVLDINNQKIWLYINGVPVFDEIKKFKGYRGVARDITEQKIEHEKLSWNKNILKLISDSSLQGLYFVDNNNNEILFFNKRFCEIWEIEEYQKQLENGLISNKEIISILSTKVKDSKQFLQSFEISKHEIYRLKFENEFLLLNNRIIYSYSSQVVNDDGIYIGRVYTFEDISAYKVYDSMNTNDIEYSDLIEQAPDAIVIANSEANILTANSMFVELLGYNKSELLKMNIVDIMEPTDLVLTPLRLNELNTGKTLLVERYFLNNRGDKIRTQVRVKKTVGNKIFAIIRELPSSEKNINIPGVTSNSELLKILYTKLKSFKHGEDSAMILNRISLFTRNIDDIWTNPDLSSDITEPEINRKLGNLSRAKSLAEEYIMLSFPQLKHLISLMEIIEIELTDLRIAGLSKININDLKRASEFLKNCFDKFLESTMIKIEVPEQYKNRREIIESVKTIKKSLIWITKIFENYFLSDLREEIYFVINKYEQLHHDILISFSDFSNNTLAIVNNDELKEVLTILFTNSIEALSISDVKNKRINISLRDTEKKFIIDFENNGICIEENIRKKLFTDRISTKGEARGFGLHYARNCLLKYGGNISVDDNYDKGTKFSIELTPI